MLHHLGALVGNFSHCSGVYCCMEGLCAICTFVETFENIYCREFRPLLKDCYSQDTSQSSRLCFELKRSEAQNLCRLFNTASARVNLGVGTSRTPSHAAASGSKPAAGAASSTSEPATTNEVRRCIVYSLSVQGWWGMHSRQWCLLCA